ncbi:MAG: RNA-binding protein [Parcubacteria group bacterium]
MAKKLYVGNLAYETTSEQLKEQFSAAGEVEEAVVITDKFSGRSKGFGFVTMVTDEDATKAIEMFDEQEFSGRPLKVNEARPREDRPAA